MRLHPAPLLLVSLVLAGCASDSTRFPSLLPRDVEKRSDLEPVRPVAAVEPDAALDAVIAEADRRLTTSHANFETAAAKADQATGDARGALPGSEAWLNAQRSLGDLDGVRAETAGIAADLDRAAIARASDGKPSYPTLEAVRARVQAEINAQERRAAALQASVAATTG